MTIEEAQQKKSELENAVCELCKKFEEETDLTISTISVFKIGHGLTESETTHVNIDIKL
jgi:hypothetical protein